MEHAIDPQSDRIQMVLPRILLLQYGVALWLSLVALFVAWSGDLTSSLFAFYLAAYLGHGFLLPRPYIQITGPALVVRTPYHRYAIPWTEIHGTREDVWPRPKGLKGLLWSILTLQIGMKPMPTLVLELTRPRWTVIGILLPPIAFPLRTTTWDFFRSDEFDEYFKRITNRVAIDRGTASTE